MTSHTSNTMALADEIECESCHEGHCYLNNESLEEEIGLKEYIGYGCNGECHEHNPKVLFVIFSKSFRRYNKNKVPSLTK